MNGTGSAYNDGPKCDSCGEPLRLNSAHYDGYGTPRSDCTNPDCDEYWLDN